jgi:hypothetical protein
MKVIRRRRTSSSWCRPRGRVDARALWWYYRGANGLFTIVATPRQGVSLATVEVPGEVVIWPRGVDFQTEEMQMKKKTKSAESAKLPHLAAVETNLLANHMGIVNHCAVTRYDDGDERKPGWISVKTFGSAWQVEAKDPDTCCSMRVVQPSLDDALALLNLLLESEEAPWEPDTWLQQQAAKSKKKA